MNQRKQAKFLREVGLLELSRYMAESRRRKELDQLGREFAKKRDPILGLEIVCVASKLKLEIPGPITAWLAEAFESYFKAGGKVSMDRKLHLSGPSGHRSAWRAHHIRKRDQLYHG